MTNKPSAGGQSVGPNPSQSVPLDYPTLGGLMQVEAQDLVDDAGYVNDEIQHLARDQDWEPAARIDEEGAEVPCSPDELIARLNGIGQTAYRLARHVRTLVELRAFHLERRAGVEAVD